MISVEESVVIADVSVGTCNNYSKPKRM